MSLLFPLRSAAVFTVLLLFAGCSKEPVDTVKEASAGVGSTKRDGKDCIDGVRMECGMLSFTSQQQFTDVYDCLEAAYEAHLGDFEAQYGGLSEDDYNDMADQLGFVDEQPFIDFEQAMSFFSARDALADAEELFLLGGGHPSNSPSLSSQFDDDIMATLFNVHGAVMIDGVIHVIDSEGNQWTFCSCNIYQQWLQDPNSVNPEDPCSLVLKGGVINTPTCKSDWWQYCWREYVTDEKEVNWKLQVKYWQFWDHSSATARIWHYKWKNNRWKPSRADLMVRSYGWYNNAQECQKLGSYDANRAKKRKALRVRYIPPVQIASYLDREAKGYWEFPGSNYVNMALDYTLPDEGENCP